VQSCQEAPEAPLLRGPVAVDDVDARPNVTIIGMPANGAWSRRIAPAARSP
jgi:hypothetical protein